MRLFEACNKWEETNTPFAFVTIISSTGTVSRREGRMAVSKSGECLGTIGGGAHEAEARSLALSALKNGKNVIKNIKVRDKGEISVMIDIPVKDRSVIILGAGHVGKALYDIFHYLKWHVTVIDPRKEINTEESFPYGERVVSDYRPSLGKVTLDDNTAIISTVPEINEDILPLALHSRVFYIGLLSSRKRVWSNDVRVFSPMGVDLGEETPEEIALSTSSEVLARFNHRHLLPHSEWRRRLVVVRGAGDLATGTIIRLHNAGYHCIALEIPNPTVIRRTVSFADVVYEGTKTVEGVECRLAKDIDDALDIINKGSVPLLVDPKGETIEKLKPGIVVDAIIAKKNLGTRVGMAPFVVAMGPGFTAGVDADVVIETMRGHNLGRLIYEGRAMENTGTPGLIGGKGKERVIHSSKSGVFKGNREIGDIVEEGDIIGYVDDEPQRTTIFGRLRGLLHDGLTVPEHFKIADVDPRGEETDHTTVSDKARALGGAVLEAIDNALSGISFVH